MKGAVVFTGFVIKGLFLRPSGNQSPGIQNTEEAMRDWHMAIMIARGEALSCLLSCRWSVIEWSKR